MGLTANATPVASDAAKVEGTPRNRPLSSRFEWVSPSPPPATVAALERQFPDVVQVPLQALEEETTEWGIKAVIARSLSRWVPPEAIVRELRRAGATGSIEPICLAHRHYLLRFSDPSAKLMALGNPWTVNGQVIAMEDWRPQFVPTEDSLSSALLWIRLPSLPLEFWSEAILSSILAVAGSFVFLDSATRERKRGGYARACVKVDLGKPLRPGVRVRGTGSPFWQAFVYEHIEGVCNSCGSLHQAEGGCSAPEKSSDVATPLFGPWMAAVRRQRLPQAQSLDHSVKPHQPAQKVQGAASSPSSATEGWQAPKKPSRRKSGASAAVNVEAKGSCSDGFSVGGTGNPGMPDGTAVKPACRSLFTVPIQTEGSGLPDSTSNSKAINTTDNPFALLGSDKWAGRPKSRKEANPGPLKRSRPGDYSTPRVGPKATKGKGKLFEGGNHDLQSTFTFSASLEVPKGKGTRDGQGSMLINTPHAQSLGVCSEASQLTSPELCSHDSVVGLLKKAIQIEVAGVAMESQDQETPAGGPLASGPTDTEMIGDHVGPPF